MRVHLPAQGGDAACGATIGGMGTGTAVVAAYVPAGEPARAGGDHRTAFARYERLLRPFARRCQKGGDRTGRFFAPRWAIGAPTRDAMLRRPALLALMLRAGEQVAGVDLPTYPPAAALD
ncbi:hypothetical protein [Kitasatospora cinereorecta]|uniref:Uncharacterized protein n=1 Tax=Kitasatospora cinereorecta TaxID=285560 RepID=A0ABW0VS74_9ACTN